MRRTQPLKTAADAVLGAAKLAAVAKQEEKRAAEAAAAAAEARLQALQLGAADAAAVVVEQRP